MADIKKYLDSIKTAIFGKDVRKSIHDGIEAINNDCTNRLNKQDSELSQNIKKQNEIIQANKLKQDELERKYDEQIKNIASGEYQNAEIVDARSGFPTLGSIIKQKIYHFNNVEEMKNCLTLIPGDVVETLGYHEANDGGGATYRIRTKTENDVEDGGSIHFLSNDFIAELNVKETVNVKQFGAKTVKITNINQICNELDNEEDCSVYFNNALTYIYNLAFNNKTRGFNCNLFVPSGSYIIKNTIILSSLTHLIANGLVSFYWINTSDEEKYCFKIGTVDTDLNYVLGGASQRFRAPLLDGSVGSLSIYNVKKDKTDIAIGIGGYSDNSVLETSIIDTVEIEGFKIGVELYCKNLYLNRFKNVRINSCEKAIALAGELTNSGENILWEKATIACCNVAIYFENFGISMKFVDSSFDGNGLVLYQATPFYNELIFDRCWIEACGYDMSKKNPIAFNNLKCIAYVEELTEQVRDYIKTVLILKNTIYVDSSSKCDDCSLPYLFSGNTLKLVLDNFLYQTWIDYAETTPNFLCNNNVTDIINKNYIRSVYGTAPFVSQNENLIQYSNFDGEEAGYRSHAIGTSISKDFEISECENISYLGIKNENGVNILQITREDTSQAAKLTLKSKFKIIPNNSQDVLTRLKIRTDADELQNCKFTSKFNYYDLYGNNVTASNWNENSIYVKEDNYYIPKRITSIDTNKFNSNLAKVAELLITINIPNTATSKNVYIKNLELYDSSNRARYFL